MSPPGIRPTALIDFRSPDDGVAPLRLAFGAPREVLRATSLDAVVPLLARVDALARAGAWCVGYLCYEAAGAFDEAFETHAPSDPARAAGGVRDPRRAAAGRVARSTTRGTATVRWTGGPQRDAFDATIAEILRAIADGEVYQVNATAPLTGTLQGDPLALFAALRRAQPNAYAAYLDLGDDGARRRPHPVGLARAVLRLARRPPAGASDEGHRAARRDAGRGRRAVRVPAQRRQGARREPDDRRPAAQRPLAHRRAASRCACRACSTPRRGPRCGR